ncbi:ATP-grasp domain-containing protein [Streptomyces sp. XY332]|uniref:ATP-grasp domain-containing protein n=1 Tax=Streptomyces sp. XY332 TaxID=1415561 RepID=UPI0006B15B91|nr:ATP-grasp domain-containing protein [Streptomyces sp. XY332]KOY59480.1 biotin carboxylase [Streptomyces sp. XY332]
MNEQQQPGAASGPVLIVGFVGVTLAAIGEFQPDDSVIYIEEPDVVRKRHVHEQLDGVAFARGLIEWEYHLAGKADEFHNAHPDLAPVAVVPAIEYATPFAARLAERYGLPGAGLGAAQILRDKALLRQVSAAAGIANPASVRVEGPAGVRDFLRGLGGPVVLKPANRQAAVGTRVIHHPAEVEQAWADCLVQDEGVFVPDRPMELSMLAEQYVEGPEFSVEMLVRDGRALFVNVTGKQLFPGPHPVEMAHTVPADIPEDLAETLGAQTARVVRAVGFRDGIVHCEWIVSNGVPYLVECAGRLAGGGIVDTIQLAYPVQLMRSYYAVMKGEEPPAELPRRAKGGAAVRFLATGAGRVTAVHGVEAARQVDGVFLVAVTAGPGDRFTGLRHSWDRAGIVMATADSSTEALRRAEAAAAAVRIDIEGEA